MILNTFTDQNRSSLRDEILRISSKNRRRRELFSKVLLLVSLLSLGLAFVPLLDLIGVIVAKGAPVLNATFFTQAPIQPSFAHPAEIGGVSNAIVGSIALIVYSAVLAVPIGVLTGIFTAENENIFASTIRLIAQTMAGAPSILMGLCAFILVSRDLGFGLSAVSGSVALAALMLPVIIVATEIAVRNVPQTLREAGLALGAKPHTVSLRVTLPNALPGISTGVMLALARGIGEAAPVLLTVGGTISQIAWQPQSAVAALPLTMLNDAKSIYPAQRQQVFGIAIVLLAVVFVTTISARFLIGRRKNN